VVLVASIVYVVAVLLYENTNTNTNTKYTCDTGHDVIVTVSPTAFDGLAKRLRSKEEQTKHDHKQQLVKKARPDKSEAAGDVVAFVQNPHHVQGKRQLAAGEIPDDVPEQGMWDEIRIEYGKLEGTLAAMEEDPSFIAQRPTPAAGGGAGAGAARPPVNSFTQRVVEATAASHRAAEAKPSRSPAATAVSSSLRERVRRASQLFSSPVVAQQQGERKSTEAPNPDSFVARVRRASAVLTRQVVAGDEGDSLVGGNATISVGSVSAGRESHGPSLMDRARRALSIPVTDFTDDTAGLMAMMAAPEVPRTEWYRRWDDSSAEYFVSTTTDESVWDLPEGGVLVKEPGVDDDERAGDERGGTAVAVEIWVQRFDNDTGAHYYVNTNSQETTWDRPESTAVRIISEDDYAKLTKWK
jgi:hypothetical protein